MQNRALLVALVTVLIGGPAGAATPDGSDDRNRVRRATTILFSEDTSHLTPDGFEVAPWLAENLRLDQRGFKYINRFGEKGSDRIVLRIRGPLMRKNRFGLTLDLRF